LPPYTRADAPSIPPSPRRRLLDSARFRHLLAVVCSIWKGTAAAFDSVAWPFLLEVLQQLGFGHRWCNLLWLLLSTSTTQILLNGEPGETIHHHRGLRQGDPLSPMLFILVMDVLNTMINLASNEHLLHPLTVQQVKHRISFYADVESRLATFN
jgi:hypothetical protein